MSGVSFTVFRTDGVSRDQMLERWLFEAITGMNSGRLSREILRVGLSHCLTARNEAVSRKAASLLLVLGYV